MTLLTQKTQGAMVARPSLSSLLGACTLPSRSLLIGVADDGKPLALNLLDPNPGAILVVGDPGCGKTDFLRILARSAALTQRPTRLKFAVITPRPGDWMNWKALPHCAGVLPSQDAAGISRIVNDLADWVQTDDRSQSRLLLIEDLDALRGSQQATDTLTWLIREGAQSGAWVIATLSTPTYLEMVLGGGINPFGTLVLGRIADPNTAQVIAYGAPASQLLSGEFCKPSKYGGWRSFWLPTL